MLAVASPARAWSTYLEERATWPAEVPYALHMPSGRHVDPAFREELTRALQVWTSIACSGLRVRYTGTTAASPNVAAEGADGRSVIGFAERAWPYGQGVTAVTRVRAREGALVEADMLLNAVDYEWRASSVPPGTRRLRALRFTLPHELGHFFGLGHSEDAASLMHPAALNGAPGADDVQGMCTLYPRGRAPRAMPAAVATGSGQLTGRLLWSALVILAITALVAVRRARQRRILNNRP